LYIFNKFGAQGFSKKLQSYFTNKIFYTKMSFPTAITSRL